MQKPTDPIPTTSLDWEDPIPETQRALMATHDSRTTPWNGIPPNGQGMYHWLVNKDHRRHVVAWFDLHEWTAFGKAQTKQEIAAMYDYLAPCDPPSVTR